jgi:hypothetical protein
MAWLVHTILYGKPYDVNEGPGDTAETGWLTAAFRLDPSIIGRGAAPLKSTSI